MPIRSSRFGRAIARAPIADDFHLAAVPVPPMPIGDVPPRSFRLGNDLIGALPESIRQRWARALEFVEVVPGQLLHEPGTPLAHAYFPVTAVVSLLGVLENGTATEVAMIGAEGVVGAHAMVSGGTAGTRAVVHIGGTGLRLPAAALRQACDEPAARAPFQRFEHALFEQIAQISICSRHHTLEQRVCRWLLDSLDRVCGDEFAMTHELVAGRLGVRRESITECALSLKRLGLVAYGRGRIRIVDRAGLGRCACECRRVTSDARARSPGHLADGCAGAASGDRAERTGARASARARPRELLA